MASSYEPETESRRRVHVVDDDPSIRRALRRLFAAEGVDVSTYVSAEAFLETAVLESSMSLVLDENLGGMSGRELASELERRGLHPSVVLISAAGLEDSRHVVLHKPFTAALLFDALRRANSPEAS